MTIKNKIIEDLEQMKQINADKDTTLQVISKEEIKEKGGLTRSTDYGDPMMMRIYFELKPPMIVKSLIKEGAFKPVIRL